MTAPSARIAPPRWRWRLWDLLLLPLALLLILLEDVLWQGAVAVLRGLSALPPLMRLRLWLGTLSGWAALPLFLVPELAGRVGEVWVALLLLRGHLASAVLVYCLVRLVALLIAVFIWQACAPALLQLAWFARIIGWIEQARDWALARTRAVRDRLRVLRGRGVQRVLHRVQMLRHMVRPRR